MRSLLPATLAILACATTGLTQSQPPAYAKPEPLYTQLPAAAAAMPDKEAVVERGKPERPDRSFRNVTRPLLFWYPAPGPGPSPAIVICPGGGYGSLAEDKEGHEVARWLNTLGISGAVLHYRLPHPELGETVPWPQQDAREAVARLRREAEARGIVPNKIGIMGFSAGGHLAASTCVYPLAAASGGTPASRPDFAVLVYPVISFRDGIGHSGSRNSLLGRDASAESVAYWSLDEAVHGDMPPTFLVQAANDGVSIENSKRYEAALIKAGISVGTCYLSSGGHGYGLGRDEITKAWPEAAAAWLRKEHIISADSLTPPNQ